MRFGPDDSFQVLQGPRRIGGQQAVGEPFADDRLVGRKAENGQQNFVGRQNVSFQIEHGDQFRAKLQQELKEGLRLQRRPGRARFEQLPSPAGAEHIERDGDQRTEKRLLVGVGLEQLVQFLPVEALV